MSSVFEQKNYYEMQLEALKKELMQITLDE